jgi:hypothetical protein
MELNTRLSSAELGMSGAMPSLCAAIINSSKLLNRNIENPKLLRRHQLKHRVQTREHNVCSGRGYQRCAPSRKTSQVLQSCF